MKHDCNGHSYACALKTVYILIYGGIQFTKKIQITNKKIVELCPQVTVFILEVKRRKCPDSSPSLIANHIININYFINIFSVSFWGNWLLQSLVG